MLTKYPNSNANTSASSLSTIASFLQHPHYPVVTKFTQLLSFVDVLTPSLSYCDWILLISTSTSFKLHTLISLYLCSSPNCVYFKFHLHFIQQFIITLISFISSSLLPFKYSSSLFRQGRDTIKRKYHLHFTFIFFSLIHTYFPLFYKSFWTQWYKPHGHHYPNKSNICQIR